MADLLAEILRTVRMTGGVFLDARFTAPWCVVSQMTPEDCKPFLAVPADLIAYHVVIEGCLWLQLDGDPAVEIDAGKIVLLPRNDRHTLASGPGLVPVMADDLIKPTAEGGLARIAHGGGGAVTRIVCGFLGSEDMRNPLIASLPRVLTLDIREAASRAWVEESVRFAARELSLGRLASLGVVSRLSELLFVEAVRNYVATLSDDEAGWLKGLKDPYVGRALALLHGRFDEPWTAESLAGEVSLSRSAFHDRFTSLVGVPPMRYLTRWRLQVARERLREVRGTIAQIAHAVGYESEVAFNRAFKREFGQPPARWRDAQSPKS
jgi:AraC-like DNA-binding protein